ncbi:hypothetical protein [Saccharopolyspora shandongensis]|uniref:hypothetical protein n=1 Tax=Saccharopolyspora shandongensis TaxID=418495 RepID=UPI003408CB57
MTPENDFDAESYRNELMAWFRSQVAELCQNDLRDIAEQEPLLEPRLTEELFSLVIAAVANDRERVADMVEQRRDALRPWSLARRALPGLAEQLRTSGDALSEIIDAPLDGLIA